MIYVHESTNHRDYCNPYLTSFAQNFGSVFAFRLLYYQCSVAGIAGLLMVSCHAEGSIFS